MKFSLRVKLMVIGAVLVAIFLSGAADADDDFIRLCSKGTIEQIEKAIRSGVDVNARFTYGSTALMLAARDNPDPRVIVALLRAGAKINAVNQDGTTHHGGETALTAAARHNPNPEVITTLIKLGADLDAKIEDSFGTVLMVAMKNPNLVVMPLLIKAGADVNATNKDGETILMQVVKSDKFMSTIPSIIRAGADVNAEDRNGWNALEFYLHYSKGPSKTPSESIVKLLTPTMVSDRKFIELCRKGSSQEVEEAIKSGANVNARDESGRTPLMYAIARPAPEIISVLIKAGADINAKDGDGRTPLISAMWYGAEMTRFFLANGASPEGAGKHAPNEEVVDLLYQYPECEEYFDNLIETVKSSYWGDYSKRDGYAPLGEAFEEFFGRPKWTVIGGRAVVFTGVAQSNNKRAMLKVEFNIDGQSIRVGNYTINGNKADWNDLLAAVYLN